MPRIERLKLHKVGPFGDLELDFPEKPKGSKKAELHLFTGQNGTGKTSLVFAAAAVVDGLSSAGRLLLPRLSQADSYVHVGFNDIEFFLTHLQSTNSTPVFLPSHDLLAYSAHYNDPGRGACWMSRDKNESPKQEYIPSESIKRINYNPKTQSPNVKFDWVPFGYSGSRILEPTTILGIEEIDESPFENAVFAPQGARNQLSRWIVILKSKSALYREKGDRKKAEQLLAALKIIEKAVSDIIGVSVKFSMDIDPIQVFFDVNGTQLTFDLLPEGLKSILSWLADLLMRLERIPWEGDVPILERSFVLFLDEVDVHLHPAWQRKVLRVAQELFPNAQIFATTHSPFVVGSLDEGFIYRFDLDEKGESFLAGSHEAKPGRSIELILDEVFGVKKQFDDTTEEKFSKLRELRETVLSGKEPDSLSEWNNLLDQLDMMGIEVAAIAARERRQVARLLGNE